MNYKDHEVPPILPVAYEQGECIFPDGHRVYSYPDVDMGPDVSSDIDRFQFGGYGCTCDSTGQCVHADAIRWLNWHPVVMLAIPGGRDYDPHNRSMRENHESHKGEKAMMCSVFEKVYSCPHCGVTHNKRGKPFCRKEQVKNHIIDCKQGPPAEVAEVNDLGDDDLPQGAALLLLPWV